MIIEEIMMMTMKLSDNSIAAFFMGCFEVLMFIKVLGLVKNIL
jgi:hypothetical protein